MPIPLGVSKSPARRAALAAVVAAACIIASPRGARAQETGSLRGRVTDLRTGAPVDGAELRLSGPAEQVARSDSRGAWRAADLRPGAYRLSVRRLGYRTRELGVTVRPGAEAVVAVELAALPRSLDDVVVTASRRAERLKDVAVTTELVRRSQIEETGASDLASVLAEQTGVQFHEGHPSGAGVMLQGLGSERVLVLLDGQPLVGRIAGNFDVSRIPTSVVERVEIVKGPQSTLYGSEAMGGVINIITRDAAPESWTGGLRLTGGTDGRLDAGAAGSFARGGVAVSADVGRRRVERAPGRAELAGALADRTDGAAKIRVGDDSARSLEVSTLLLSERQRWLAGTFYDFADNTQVNARATAAWAVGAHRLAPTLHLSQFDHQQRRSTLPTPTAGTGNRQRQRLAEAELLYAGPVGGHTLDAGLEVKQEFISSTDGRIEGGSRTLTSAEPFAQYTYASGRWTVVPGLRLTWNEQWGSYLAPRVAIRYGAPGAPTLRVSAGRGFRAPDFKELYLNFTNDAAGYAVYGNRDLRPETSTNFTAGAEWGGDGAYARTQLFWNELTDFIETTPLPTSGPLVLFQYGNVERGRTRGGELEAGLTRGRVSVEAGYSYLNARDVSTGGPLLGRPTHSARATVGASLVAGTRGSIAGVYTGSTPMTRDSAGRVTGERDSFLRFDVRLARTLPRGFEVTLGADNLFDDRPAEWAGAVGRQLYAGLAWNISGSAR